jgi:hypothetical protein
LCVFFCVLTTGVASLSDEMRKVKKRLYPLRSEVDGLARKYLYMLLGSIERRVERWRRGSLCV